MGNKVNVQITPESLHGVTPIKHVTINTSNSEEEDDDDKKEEEETKYNCCCCKCCLKIFACLVTL